MLMELFDFSEEQSKVKDKKFKKECVNAIGEKKQKEAKFLEYSNKKDFIVEKTRRLGDNMIDSRVEELCL